MTFFEIEPVIDVTVVEPAEEESGVYRTTPTPEQLDAEVDAMFREFQAPGYNEDEVNDLCEMADNFAVAIRALRNETLSTLADRLAAQARRVHASKFGEVSL